MIDAGRFALLAFCVVAFTRVHAAEPALRIEGAAGPDGVVKPTLTLGMSDLATLPRASAKVRGHDGTERTYQGVRLSDLLKKAGQPFGENLRGSLLSKYVLVSAHDGYRVLFSLPEVDPAFSEARIILADTADGKPLPDREGPLRLIVPS